MERVTHKRRKIDHRKSSNVLNGYVPVTTNVVSSAYETDLFTLQTEDLLSEIRPKPSKRFQKLRSVLGKLKSNIEGIDEHTPITVRGILYLSMFLQ